MPVDSIALLLQSFKHTAHAGLREIEQFSHESPMDRMRKEIQEQLEKSEKYRASILMNVTTFAGLSSEAVLSAARSMEEVFYKKGDHIIQQDEIGDSFFVLEEGLVSVTRKANVRDSNEVPRELAQLGKNAHFGEIALLTAEPRSATITVISPDAKCLRMTKQKFEELLATTNQIQAENRKQIGRDVLEEVPLFKSLTNVNKKKLLDAMISITYLPQTYICRQGTAGNTFYILTEGTCKVTVNERDGSEKEVAKLHPGDFFGEVALIESSNRRTANVISVENVSCLTLNRNDFNRLLKSLKVKIIEQQASRSGNGNNPNNHDSNENEVRQLNTLSKKRRISGYNTHGQRDELRIASLLKRFAKFSTEALWNSLYSRMYREMLLDTSKVAEYGKYANFIMRSNDTRYEAVKAINDQAVRALETDPSRRSPADNSFIYGLMKQRNFMKDRLCRSWPQHQFIMLCKRMKIMRVKPFRKIIEVDSRGTTVFMILRGCVRIFSRLPGTSSSSKVFFEEDLFPGEIFGEAALSGMHTRLITALSMTNVDLVYIDDQDYMTAQDRDSIQMGTEERSKFLAQVPMFRNWDSYKLLRLAHALVQEEIDKGTVLTKHGMVSKDIYFIVTGRVDIVDSVGKRNIITTLLKNDYFGESGFVNKYQKKGQNNIKHTEEFYAVAVSKLDILILQEVNFHLFDMASVVPLRSAFIAKVDWRRERVQKMKVERAIMRKQYFNMHTEAEQLPIWTMNGQQGMHGGDSTPYSMNMDGMDKRDDTALLQITGRPDSPDQFEKASRPSSPVPMETTPRPAALPISPIDKAYQTALVHPLDEKLNSSKYWMEKKALGDSDSDFPKVKLDNIEDIPVLLAKDFDLLMVSASCNVRAFEKTQDFLSHGKRPLSGKNSAQTHNSLSYTLSSTRPASSHRHGQSFDSNMLNISSSDYFPSLTPTRETIRPATTSSSSRPLVNTMGLGMNVSFDTFHNNHENSLVIHAFHPLLQTQLQPLRPSTSDGAFTNLFDKPPEMSRHGGGISEQKKKALYDEVHNKGTVMKGITHLSTHPLVAMKKPPPVPTHAFASTTISPRADIIVQSSKPFVNSPKSKKPGKKSGR